MSTRPWGTCGECGGDFRLTKSGMLWHHNQTPAGVWPPTRCKGAGKPPAFAPSPPPQPATTRLAAEADDLEQRYVAQRERAERAEEALQAAEARIRALEGGA